MMQTNSAQQKRSTERILETLRERVFDEPSREGWESIVALVHSATGSPDADSVLAYVAGHFGVWEEVAT